MTSSELLKNADDRIRMVGVMNFVTEQRSGNPTPGTCLRCKEEIPKERLTFVPEAPFCCPCQKAIDLISPPKPVKATGFMATSRYGGDDDRAQRGSPTLYAGNRRTATA